MIDILIADDHPIVRGGFKQFISDEEDMQVIAEAEDSDQLFRELENKNIDVIVMDFSMPGMSGMELIQKLKLDYPDIPLLILSMHPEEQYAVRVIKSGASGYLNKESAPDQLVNAIRTVFKGKKYISPVVAELLAEDAVHPVAENIVNDLSDREFQVMCKIARGKTVKEISEELYLSVTTVSTYRSRILEKTGLKNNGEIAFYCIKNKIIE